MAIIQDIKPTGFYSAYAEAPFDEAKEELEKAGYQIISLEKSAELRMLEGKEAFVSKNGNYTREGVLYVPGKGKFLTKKSPIMANAKEATACHRSGKDFHLTDSQIEEALSDSVLLSIKSVPTNRFSDCDITVYAFGNSAEKYGQFLKKDAGINEMSIWTADLKGKSFVKQVWLSWLGGDGGSDLLGAWDLDGSLRVRGVRESAEGTAKSFEAPQIRATNIAEILQYSRIFVPEVAREQFEKGLTERLKQ
jgi:hypothetical protein